jgi:hypothetical protein
MGGYVYRESEPGLFTVGHYNGNGVWVPESDHSTTLEASRRCSYLNGGAEALLARLREHDKCDACLGVPPPAGRPCICGGTGLMTEAVANMRLELGELRELAARQLAKGLPESKGISPFILVRATANAFGQIQLDGPGERDVRTVILAGDINCKVWAAIRRA